MIIDYIKNKNLAIEQNRKIAGWREEYIDTREADKIKAYLFKKQEINGYWGRETRYFAIKENRDIIAFHSRYHNIKSDMENIKPGDKFQLHKGKVSKI